MKYKPEELTLGLLRIAMGWTFLWPFIDKLLGMQFTTPREQSWLNGASPTSGFLKFAVKGPFSEIFHLMAGNTIVDWLFMLGLLCIGLSLIFGIGIKIATISGSLLMLMLYSAVLPPEHNPVIDEHIIYILVLIALYFLNAKNYLGFGERWSRTSIVKKYSILL